ncbi:MAG TPA: hypothetical protein P5572_04975 [Phycisphaerae bacterium]|nr:hypothetical protein [Phycisphaerae bacterium]
MTAARHHGPKVKELAAELGVKPRVVQAAAAELGIFVQNRLTRITPADAARIRTHVADRSAPDAPPPDPPDDR